MHTERAFRVTFSIVWSGDRRDTEQVDFRHNVAMKLDWDTFADLIVDAVERLTAVQA